MKVLIGLSGGVDSAVAAYLLKQQGYEVSGGFMRNWDALANNDYLGNPTLGNGQCPQEKDYWDAKAVADKLGIELYRSDFVKEYWDSVFKYFLDEYKKGRTPNPDVFCNKYIKFDSFRKFAKENGFDMIAMGHYAGKTEKNGHTYICKAKDLNKDQSYFLSQINEEQIKSCIFPLNEIDKPKVREIAHSLDLASVMDKKDSTGVCFIGERNFKQFLNNYFPATKGDIVDGATNTVIGKHMGVLYYTIGQRKGLGIGGIKGRDATSWFIYKKDVEHNILYVSDSADDSVLFADSCIAKDVNWIGEKPAEPTQFCVKTRYRQEDKPCHAYFKGDDLIINFDEPVKAVTPGQIAVIYDGDIMLGGGIIDSTYRDGKRIDI